jgi:hypothetical protein
MARSIGTRYPRGGSNQWVGPNPGAVVLDDAFFGSPPPIGGEEGYVPVWTGAAHARKPAKVWLSGAWVIKPAKRWTGALWSTT